MRCFCFPAWIGLFSLAALGCAGPSYEELEAIEVSSASIANVTWANAGVIGGIASGDGDLQVVDVNGATHDFPIKIEGGFVGAAVEVRILLGVSFLQSAVLKLPEDAALTANDLLGHYSGQTGGAVAGIGVSTHSVKNGSGVELEVSGLALGAGGAAGIEWVTLDLENPPDPPADDAPANEGEAG